MLKAYVEEYSLVVDKKPLGDLQGPSRLCLVVRNKEHKDILTGIPEGTVCLCTDLSLIPLSGPEKGIVYSFKIFMKPLFNGVKYARVTLTEATPRESEELSEPLGMLEKWSDDLPTASGA